MPNRPTPLLENIEEQPARLNLISIGASISVSLLIFVGIIQAQKTKFSLDEPTYEEVRAVVIPSPPPPPREDNTEDIPAPPEVLSLDAEETDANTIQIAYAPQTIQAPSKPIAVPEFRFSIDSFRPSDNQLTVGKSVYRKNEVDQPPVPIYKKVPKISNKLLDSVDIPQVAILYIVNTDGSVSSVRLLRSTDPEFDRFVIDAAKMWRFRPAVKDGQYVRCWISQKVTIKKAGRNPFSIN